MASVRKREWTHNGTKREAWVCAYTDQDGKRRLKTFDKKKEADAFRQKAEAEINAGVHTAASASVTVAEAVREYLGDCERRRRIGDLTGNTIRKARWTLEDRLVKACGARLLTDLTSDWFQAYLDELRGSGLSDNSVLGIYGDAARLLAFAVRKKWIKRSILKDEPCRVPAAVRRTAIPSKADIQLLIDHAETRSRSENLRTTMTRSVVINLGVFAGLRPGETFGLQWSDIDRDAGLIRIRHSLSIADGLKGPKSKAGRREVPITPPVARALDRMARFAAARASVDPMEAPSATDQSYRLLRDWTPEGEAPPDPLAGFVLLTTYGRPYNTSTFQALWNPLMKGLGLWDEPTGRPKFTPHALRHAAASLWIEARLPDLHLKTLLGHANVSTTYNIYGHVFPEDRSGHEIVASVAARFALPGPSKQANEVRLLPAPSRVEATTADT